MDSSGVASLSSLEGVTFSKNVFAIEEISEEVSEEVLEVMLIAVTSFIGVSLLLSLFFFVSFDAIAIVFVDVCEMVSFATTCSLLFSPTKQAVATVATRSAVARIFFVLMDMDFMFSSYVFYFF